MERFVRNTAMLVLVAGITRAAVREALIAAVVVATLGALGVGIGLAVHGRGHEPRWWRAWLALGLSVLLHAIGAVLAALPASGGAFATAPLTVVAAAGACFVFSMTTLHAHRTSTGRAIDVLWEAVVGGITVGFLLWALLVTPATVGTGLTLAVGVLVIDLAGLWLLGRLLVLTREHPASYRYLLVAQVCLLTVHAVAVLALVGGLALQQRTATFVLWAVCLMAAAALHPSLKEPFQPVPPRPVGLSAGHVVLLVAGVLLGPAVVGWRVAVGAGADLPVALAGTAGLPLLVVLHLVRLVQQRARAEYRARHDELTGLPNRVLFNDRLDVALAHARRDSGGLAVMFLDLDRFKTINDSLGHDVGNELLRAVAHRLRATLREVDTVARWGGDEFTVLLSDVESPEKAARVADKVLAAFREPFQLGARQLHAATSIGIALFPDDGSTREVLLKHADTAMYRAKSRQRNTYQLYTREMSARAQLRLAAESGLRKALAHGHVGAHFQPRIDRRTGRITGVEALARWEHPRAGLIRPSGFIALAEESGMIADLGAQVLHDSLDRAARWHRDGLLDGPVSVNLSPLQFEDGDLERQVLAALSATGLPPGMLELEITESLVLPDAADVHDVLARLREAGVRCAIDDFGTGYSGLAYLAGMPVDALKIDRVFVAGIEAGSAPIVEAVVALGRSLGLQIVAEGVETAAQAAFLADRGCTQMQGYRFGRPMAPDAFEQFSRELEATGPSEERLASLALAYTPPVDARGDEVSAVLTAASAEGAVALEDGAVQRVLGLLRDPDDERGLTLPGGLSSRLAAGSFAGLMPIGTGLAAVGALPASAQLVAADVLSHVGWDVPRESLLAAGGPLGDSPLARALRPGTTDGPARLVERGADDATVLAAPLPEEPDASVLDAVLSALSAGEGSFGPPTGEVVPDGSVAMAAPTQADATTEDADDDVADAAISPVPTARERTAEPGEEPVDARDDATPITAGIDPGAAPTPVTSDDDEEAPVTTGMDDDTPTEAPAPAAEPDAVYRRNDGEDDEQPEADDADDAPEDRVADDLDEPTVDEASSPASVEASIEPSAPTVEEASSPASVEASIEPSAPTVEEPSGPTVEEPSGATVEEPSAEEPSAPSVEEPSAPSLEEPSAEEPSAPTVEDTPTVVTPPAQEPATPPAVVPDEDDDEDDVDDDLDLSLSEDSDDSSSGSRQWRDWSWDDDSISWRDWSWSRGG